MPFSAPVFRHTYRSLEASSCLQCQWRSFSSSYRRNADKEIPPPASPPPPQSPLEDAPRAYGKAVTDFTPKPLNRPIGLPRPPRSGENTGIDSRTWKQRRDDFVDYDKHIIKRKELTKKLSAPYFREWSNMRMHKGKSFLAPPGIFKSDRSLYFPNFFGETLLQDGIARDTTPVLQDKISVVSVFSSAWAERQAATFVAGENNADLHQMIKGSRGLAQLVRINIEENSLKAWIIKLFTGRLRKEVGEENWGRYFVIRRAVSDDIRDAIGLLNSKVGYTYLLDTKCRIRWAGSGICEGDEKDGLNKGIRRLIEEARAPKTSGVQEAIRRKTDSTQSKDLSSKRAAPAAA